MTDMEIVEFDAVKNNAEFPMSVIISAYTHALNNPNVRILRHGDTLCFLEATTGEFHFVNAARFNEFITNVKAILKQMEQLGLKEAKTNFKNPRVLDVADATGYDVTTEYRGDSYYMTVRF